MNPAQTTLGFSSCLLPTLTCAYLRGSIRSHSEPEVSAYSCEPRSVSSCFFALLRDAARVFALLYANSQVTLCSQTPPRSIDYAEIPQSW